MDWLLIGLGVFCGAALLGVIWWAFIAGVPQSSATSDDYEENRRED